jgi:toxin-antitoxin system PIN domain toxin
MILPDVNVWLAVAHPNHDDHSKAVNWYQQIPQTESIAFCRHSQLGFLRNSSNHRVTKGSILSKDEAWNLYDAFFNDQRVVFLDEPPSVDSVLRSLMNGKQNNINLWTDAYLAAFALIIGCQLTAFDRDFFQFPGLNFRFLQ